MAQRLKRLPAMQETWVRSLGWEDPLEKGKAIHSRILSWLVTEVSFKNEEYVVFYLLTSLIAQLVKNPPAVQETLV